MLYVTIEVSPRFGGGSGLKPEKAEAVLVQVAESPLASAGGVD